MKKILFFFTFFLLTFILKAQINFEKGYFINNAGVKTECFIKNVDWKNNPNKFDYKITLEGDTNEATILNIQEFGIYNFSKYVRAKLQVDMSRSETSDLSQQRAPEWEEKTIFLKTIIDGKASLYYFEDGNLTRFFFSKEDLPIQQLVYKTFVRETTNIYENAAFRQQLLTYVNCGNVSENAIKKIDYDLLELQRYFTKYNECLGETFSGFSNKKNKAIFKLNIRPGLNYSTLTVVTYPFVSERKLDSEIGYRIGIEAETILPFNRNKWSLFVEPTYQSFKAEDGTNEIKYNSIQVPIGIRHYFFLNNDSKIFINGAYILDIPTNSNNSLITISSNSLLGFGIGFKINNYSFETRYSEKNLLRNGSSLKTNNQTISFIFGYSIL